MNSIFRRTRSATASCVVAFLFLLHADSPSLHAANTTTLMDALSAQGVDSSRILGVDSRGVPIVCGTDGPNSPGAFAQNGVTPNSLPGNARGWEVIPGVIRINTNDTFRVEVDVNSDVSGVTMDCAFAVTPISGGDIQVLRDDGLDQDRVAGDRIWTTGLLRGNISVLNSITPSHYGSDTNSPPGLFWWDVGSVQIVELSNQTNEFLIYPQFGVMKPSVPLITPQMLSSNIQITPHLINIHGTNQASQKYLRGVSYSELPSVTTEIYSVVPDVFDFLMFFTTDHIEQQPHLATANFTAGLHSYARINYSGTGLTPFNASSFWGSQGRLLGVNLLDTGDRGAYGNNATHEVLHQWASHTHPSLGLNDGTSHYNFRSGTGSILGGAQFIQTNGGYLINCNEGPGGARFASPMDKYMMGLIEGTNVPPIPIASSSLPSPFFTCNQVISNFDAIVTIEQIQLQEGVRTPGPATAQRDFAIGFVIESNGRLLNQVELTFFEILARQYTLTLPASLPAPSVSFGWPSITKFFGEGTTWKSYVLSFVQPTINSVEPVPGQKLAIGGLGFPRASYTIEGSTNLMNWSAVATLRADTDGVFQYTNSITASERYYRALWNE